jgi:Family of unknown function (DUF6338)
VIPQTAAALLAFLFLVAPGIVFENLRERRRPTFDQTTFREVSRVALASLCFSVLSLILLEGNGYVQGHYRVVAGFFLAELAVAVALAMATASYLGRGQGLGKVPVCRFYGAVIPSRRVTSRCSEVRCKHTALERNGPCRVFVEPRPIRSAQWHGLVAAAVS